MQVHLYDIAFRWILCQTCWTSHTTKQKNKRKHLCIFIISAKRYSPVSGSANMTALCNHGKYFRLWRNAKSWNTL